MRTVPFRVASFAVAGLLIACTAAPPSSPAASSADPLAGAREDIDRAIERLVRQHPEPFHAVDEATFREGAAALQAQLGDLTPDQAMVGLMRLWAQLASERDGHQFAFVTQDVDE